jgi:hypothetical protein
MTTRRGVMLATVASMTCAWLGFASVGTAQRSLVSRIEAVKNGRVRFTVAPRDGVCGNGMNWYRLRSTGGTSGSFSNTNFSSGRDVDATCERGVVRLVAVRFEGETTELRMYVGGTWKADTGVTDIGPIATREAGEYLLQLAERAPLKPARAAVQAVTLIDSVDASMALLRIVKDETRPSEVRSSAMNWLGEVVGERVAGTLDSIAYDAGDREVRKQAIFALSRRPADEAVPALLKMAETLPDRELRKTAVFWLSQSKDRRAVEWMEKRIGK